jgi:Response regulator containing CheY-like receiver, AAA-type ATPase, and DNA-binding domains
MLKIYFQHYLFYKQGYSMYKIVKGIMKKALIVDDDISAIAVLKKHLKDSGLKVTAVFDAYNVIEKIKHTKYDILIANFNMPDMNGIELTEQVMKIDREIVIIFITSFSSIHSVMEALMKGAFDYLSKPIDTDELLFTINRGLERVSLKNENNLLKTKLKTVKEKSGGFESKNEVVKGILKEAAKAAANDLPVLITGEKGTGKEYLADYIHNNSSRKSAQFISMDCEAMPPLILESELFGHKKNAFSGAASDSKGLFEILDGGTIVLKNIEHLETMLQEKLLRMLRDKEFSRIGDSKIISSNVRIIATTAADLEDEVKKGNFRDDLYKSLTSYIFTLPPMRERKDDIMFYFQMYLNYFCNKKKSVQKAVSEDVLKILQKYDWTGNIPEIMNLAERLSVLSDKRIVTSDLLPEAIINSVINKKNKAAVDFNSIKQDIIRQFEVDFIKKYLEKNNGNVAATAKEINFHEVSLRQKISKLGINPQKYKTNNK